jgi:hypothetical protein
MTPEEGLLFARAMLGGLDVPGSPSPLQRTVIAQVLHHLVGLDLDLDTLEPLDAGAAARLVTHPHTRRRLVQALVALELLDRPTRALAHHVRAYARALDVDEPMVGAARRIAHHQLAVMYADIMRSSYYTEETEREILHGHLWQLLRSRFASSNLVASRAIERKWAALADMPPGSLGHTTAEFYRVHRFPFPGARHGIGEVGAHHDFVHVLADYPPTPEGEIDVFAFIATSMEDPRGFVQLVMTLGLFQNATIKHVGGKRIPIACANTLDEPGAAAHFADALARGARCRVDALGIDHFAIASEPLDRLRARFDIRPREDPEQPGALEPF